MKQSWEIKRLSEIGKVYNGNSINEKVKKDNYSDLEDGFPFIATKDISYESEIDYDNGIKIPFVEKSSFKTAPKNTVLICAEGGSAGRKIGFTNQEVCFGNKLFALATNKNVESRYVYYYYFSETFQKHFAVELAGIIGGVSMNKFKDLEIPLPPLPEQQLIVSILDEAFAAIAKAKDNAEQNLKNAKELFESYLQNVFEAKGKDWEHIRLGDICQINDGTHFSPKNTSDGEYMYITAKNIKPYYIDLTKISYISKKDHKEIYARCSPVKGDVLYIKDGATAGIAAINTLDEEFSLLSSVALLKCSSKILNTFLVHYMNSTIGKKNFLGYIGGAAITRLTLIKIKNVCFSLPPIKEQKVIVQKLDALSTETKKLETIYKQKLNDLEELKKSVLQKAFSGELKTVKECV